MEKLNISAYTEEDIQWLGNVFTYKGYFGKRPIVQLKSSDKETVERVSKLWGAKFYTIPNYTVQYGHNQQYRTTIVRARAVRFMKFILPFIKDNRRVSRIKEVIENNRLYE